MTNPSDIIKAIIFLVLITQLTSCSSLPDSTEMASEKFYAKESGSKGVVILAVNWSRKWKCGKYANGQLTAFGFDLLPSTATTDDDLPTLLLSNPAQITAPPVYKHYAFLLEPGEYALSGTLVRYSKEFGDFGHLVNGRSALYANGTWEGGRFNVNAGEIVYIGHFWLDCYYGPMLWRYYMKSEEAYGNFKKQIADQFPFLKEDQIIYRLFKSTHFGEDYQLPQN